MFYFDLSVSFDVGDVVSIKLNVQTVVTTTSNQERAIWNDSSIYNFEGE